MRVSVDGEPVIYRVQKMERDGSGLSLRCHTAASLNDKRQLLRKSINSLVEKYDLQPLAVNVLGKYVDD